jgi:alkylation response protein AidB-like acyl-CoA dehydrogenase
MDARDTPEQAELRRSARQLARELGPRTVADLDDGARIKRLAGAVRDAGWLELRDDAGDGAPLVTGVEASIIADALGEAVADVAFAGPVLAADLARRAGAAPIEGAVVAFSADLTTAATVAGSVVATPLPAIDCATESAGTALVLTPEAGGFRLGRVRLDGAREAADLTRAVRTVPSGARVEPACDPGRLLSPADLDAWTALGLTLTSADLIGIARGVLDLSVSYAKQRRQYGVPIGSFQAVQHLLAEARCLLEGAFSVALQASWAIDELAPAEALDAGRVAKAYCARAARSVCETAVQVYGGMGNTWDCIVHVYLRRALLSSQWFGDDGAQLRRLERTRLGVADGPA